jgi:hypothetical protein
MNNDNYKSHILICMFSLLISFASFGQKVIDTTIYYNGRISKEKIYMDSKGQKIKETIFYKSGKIEYENFYKDGEDIRWVNYDSTGVKNGEWNNPNVEQARFIESRNLIIVLTAIFLVLTIGLGWKYIGYPTTYIIITLSTAIFSITDVIFSAQIDKLHEVIGLVIASIIIELSPFLFILSIINLFKKTRIPIILSILNIVFSAGLILLLIRSIILEAIGPGFIG